MRGGFVLGIITLVAAFVAVAGPATGPAPAVGGSAGGGTAPAGTSLLIDGSTACYATGEPCVFLVTPLDPSFLFYRWDLDGDGLWDFPSQVAGGPLGRWTVVAQVAVGPDSAFYDPAALRVCVQGWDGASTIVIGDLVQPDGPVVCTDTFANAEIRVRPGHWSESSQGAWVKVSLRLFATADPGKLDLSSLALESLSPTLLEEGSDHPSGGAGGANWVLWFDREALTAKLGPGTQTVHLSGVWGDGALGATGVVTING